MKKMLAMMLLAAPALLAGCNKSQYTAYGLEGNTIIEFDTKTPGTVSNTVTLSTVSTIDSADQVVSIFFGTDGTLYCTTNEYELCQIDTSSGTVSLITGGVTATGTNPITVFAGTNFNDDDLNGTTDISEVVAGYDPVNSNIRVFAKDSASSAPNTPNSDNLNFDIDPTTLTPDSVTGDISLVFAVGDSNAGQYPDLVSIAYSSPFSGATSSTLYGIDSTTGNLVQIGDADATSASTSVHDGGVHTIGTLGTSVSGASLTIEAKNGDAFVAIGVTLYSIDLGSGALTSIGTISDGSGDISSIAIDPSQ